MELGCTKSSNLLSEMQCLNEIFVNKYNLILLYIAYCHKECVDIAFQMVHFAYNAEFYISSVQEFALTLRAQSVLNG